MKQGPGSEAIEAVFAYRQKPHTGVRTEGHGLVLAVCLSVRVSQRVCATFVVFTDCERCTRPISTKPGSIEAGEYGLTRASYFVARRLEVVAVAGLLWICLLYTSPSPRDKRQSRMPSSA